MESRLRELEASILRTGSAVSRGGPFDRWDLEVSTGPFASARLLGASEEHGQVASRSAIVSGLAYPWPGPPLALVFGGLAIVAATGRGGPAAVLAVGSVILLGRTLFDLATGSGALLAGSDMKLLLRTLPYLRPYRGLAVLSVVILVLDAAVDLLSPWTVLI